METGFIHKETKTDIKFQTFLANLALADANHDFGDIFGNNIYKANPNAFNSGLPINPNPDINLTEKGSVLALLKDVDNLYNKFENNVNQNINITCPEISTPIHTYNAVRYTPTQKYWEGADFMEKTGLGPNIAIIVDFAQSHFMECLVNGDNKDGYNVHYLMTPELVNDPAGKPNIHDVKLFGEKTNGVNVISYLQTINT